MIAILFNCSEKLVLYHLTLFPNGQSFIHEGLVEGDVIHTSNGVVSPSFELLYKTMCSGETLMMQVERGGSRWLGERIPKKRKIGDDLRLPDAVYSCVASFLTFVESLFFAAAMNQSSFSSIIGAVPVAEIDFVCILIQI